jgi:hypothetical protein
MIVLWSQSLATLLLSRCFKRKQVVRTSITQYLRTRKKILHTSGSSIADGCEWRKNKIQQAGRDTTFAMCVSRWSVYISYIISRNTIQNTFKQDIILSNVKMRRVRGIFLQWKSDKYYIFVYVCARVFACAPGALACTCSLAYPACNSYVPRCYVIRGPSDSTIFFDIFS